MSTRLGRYAVRRRIGSGAFATVWLAYDEQLDSPVAVKVLAENWTGDHHVRRRFLEEGRYLRRVESPHVVSVYDAGELDDGRPYLVMSYADRGTLADRLAEDDALTPSDALEVVRQVGAGLTALHEQEILHRDVKPANVLFRSVRAGNGGDGAAVRAMVGDLGLGKALDISSRLTMVAGTPSFVAPEQARGEPLDARADQYSLGSLAYLLLGGRAAYSHTDLRAAGDPAPPEPLGTPQRPCSDEVDSVVRRALALDPCERWPDVAAFVDALATACGETGAAGGLAWAAAPAGNDTGPTQAGAGPSLAWSASGSPPDEEHADTRGVPAPGRAPGRRWGRRLAWAAAAVAAVAGGLGAGWLLHGDGPAEAALADDTGSLSVTVPAGWTTATSTEGWRPPNADRDYEALSAGTSADWAAQQQDGHGVFLGLLPGEELPVQLPQHPECGQVGRTDDDTTTEGASRTVVHTGCPAGVTVERVVQVTSDHLLWVQVRSADRATANRVLDAVGVHGM